MNFSRFTFYQKKRISKQNVKSIHSFEKDDQTSEFYTPDTWKLFLVLPSYINSYTGSTVLVEIVNPLIFGLQGYISVLYMNPYKLSSLP